MTRMLQTLVSLAVLFMMAGSAQGQTIGELLDQGERLVRSGRLPAAEGAFLAVLSREPNHMMAIEALAQITAFREKWHESILYYAAYSYLNRTDELIVQDCQSRVDSYARKISKKGFLVVKTNPADAVIVINGLPVGEGKVSLPISSSMQYSVAAEREDFTSPAPVVFTPAASDTKDLVINLQRIVYMGTVRLKMFPTEEVSVYVDAARVGVSPSEIQVEEGRHLLCFSRPGYDRWWRAVTVRRNESLHMEVSLRSTERPDEPCDVIPEDF